MLKIGTWINFMDDNPGSYGLKKKWMWKKPEVLYNQEKRRSLYL